jgi:hypothetical protein
MNDVVLVAGDAEEACELADISRIAGPSQMRSVSMFSCLRISRQASAIESATPLGLPAPGLMITSASQKRLPWGALFQDFSVRSGNAPNGHSPTHFCKSGRFKVFWRNLLTPKARKVVHFGLLQLQYI